MVIGMAAAGITGDSVVVTGDIIVNMPLPPPTPPPPPLPPQTTAVPACTHGDDEVAADESELEELYRWTPRPPVGTDKSLTGSERKTKNRITNQLKTIT